VSLPDPSFVLQLPGAVLPFIAGKLAHLLLAPGTFSLASLLSALCVATLFLGLKRRRRAKPLRAKVLLRALFPRRLRQSRSARADVAFFFFSVLLVGVMFGWAVVSYQFINAATHGLLVAVFGEMPAVRLSSLEAAGVMTAVLFVAYEFGYWVDHYLSHNVPFLWEFHKVHHTAEVLSPLTNFRVHPVDTIVFNNVLALVMGGAGGLTSYLLGQSVQPIIIADANVIVLAFFFLIGHLQHTHFWIPFTGFWGRVILSPAHHQIHHSTDPAHFNKNLGSFLAVWDLMFGTLHVPTAARQTLKFGVEPQPHNIYSLVDGLIAPLRDCVVQLGPFARSRAWLARRREPAIQARDSSPA
jgi:sterol desaturase/sphingolipid hydroxylase (fatty acid hydroxylase superfamily)